VARAAASGRGRPAADPEWAGEPPYDPEYDSPAKPPEAAVQSVPYEGFDPGDVPTDDVIDEKTARQTSEQQAVQLLQQALGAERIGEVELK
jgi:DNA polymerase-3 subunit gamma/tau